MPLLCLAPHIVVAAAAFATAAVDAGAAAPPPATAPAPAESGDGAAGGADDARAAARAALAEGNRRLKNGDAAGALDEYRRAQALYPASAAKLEFNVAKAEEARGDAAAAAAAFERFLASGPAAGGGAEFRAEAEATLERLSAVLGTVTVAAPRAGLVVAIDGEARGTTPLDRGVRVAPGHHVVTLADGARVAHTQEIDVAAGATLPVVMREIAVVAPPPPHHDAILDGGAGPGGPAPPLSRPIWKRWWFWTAGAVIVAGSAVLLYSAFSSDCPAGVQCKDTPLH